jgi:uracil-DNA glycosylase
MVSKDLQNLALRNAVTVALGDHAFQFLLKRLQTLDPLFDLVELPTRDRIRLRAGLGRVVREVQQLPDGVERKSELA